MIINHKYKFIFLKTAKTASTSVEIALSKWCGEGDVITPLLPKDEAIRQSLNYSGPQNYLSPLMDHNFSEILKLVLGKMERKQRYFHHIAASEVKKYVGNKIWDGYYKFCVERNPWERFISLYYWMCQSEPRPTMNEFLESETVQALKRYGIDIYMIDGHVAVDKICLYENLEGELEQVRLKLGIPEKLQLPGAKTQYRQDKRSYKDILDKDQIIKIGQLFSQEIAMFGY